MNSVETKKAKRRKTKGTVVKPTTSSNDSSRENLPKSLMDFPQDESDKERIERLIDASSEMEADLSLKLFSRGPNPFFPNCSFCNNCFVEDDTSKTDLESDDHADETSNFIKQLCHSCRESTAKVLDRHIAFDPSLLSTDFNPNVTLMSGLSALHDTKQANGADCECAKCIGRRELTAEYEREIAELEKSWEELKSLMQDTYKAQTPVLLEKDGQCINQLVHRLCLHDPHQLFLRLESQVREFVMEKRARLQKQLTLGYKTPETSSQFITLLLGEWNQLRLASHQTSKYLTDLKEHLQNFKITWELHNNHLYQSIVYTDPSIHSSLNVCVEQIRTASSYEAGFPALLQEFHQFQNDMSVTLVVWRECHQLVEAYNEEQKALKVKQKWLKEDWAFFKEQRKLLEAQVLKTSRDSLSHSVEQQFTETMRNMLSGTKPSSESAFCSRCKRKRCPCDECSITHLITCGIINQDGFENSGFHFQPERMSSYMVNVTPPSMSSTSSDSNASSPSPVETSHIRPLYTYNPDGNDEELPGSNDRDSQSEGEEEEEDEEEEEEDDVAEDDEESFGDADGEEDEEDEEISGEAPEDRLYPASILQFGLTTNPASSPNLNSTPPTSSASQDSCACHHCQAPPCTDSLLSPQPPEDGSCVCSMTGIANPFHPQVPRAAGLSLYPHIHGNFLNMRNHTSILQPQLYDLHQPMQPVSPGGSKLPVKLDPNSPSLPEQFYRTYHHSWDPVFEAENQTIPYSTGGDSTMLPPVPVLENLGFVDPHGQVVSSSVGVPAPAAFKPPASSAPPLLTTTQPTSQAVPLQLTSDLCQLQQSEELLRAHCKSSQFNYHLLQPASSLPSLTTSTAGLARSKGQTPACPRPLPVGGNAPSQMPKVEAPVQHCKMHSPGMHSRSLASHLPPSQPGAASQGPGPAGAAVLPSSFRKQQQQQQQHMPLGVPGYPCQHPPPSLRPPLIQPGIPPPPALDHGSTGGAGNVSVGTSTGMCQDPDCDGRHDDNCDSGDDSSSEKSTSTNTSNQKEGKYCDCCYCEFFGHGSPAQAATSKNYPEMRDRLRKRLEQRKTEKHEVVLKSTTRDASEERRNLEADLDEILKYINGSTKEDPGSGVLLDSSSSKARKRARQKQRKAEEARQRELARQKAEEEQRRCLEEEAAKLRAQQEAEKAEQQAAEAAAAAGKKRKSRHKASAPKENVEPRNGQNSTRAVCEPPCPGASPSRTPPAPKPQSLVERASSQLNCPNPNIIKDVVANSSAASRAAEIKAAVQQQQLQHQHRQQLLQQQFRQTAKRSKAANSPAKEVPSKAGTPHREPAPAGAPTVNGKASHSGLVNGSSAPLILAAQKSLSAEGGANKSNNHVAGAIPIKKSQAAASRNCLPMFTPRMPLQLQQNGTSQPSHAKSPTGPGTQLPNPFSQSRVSMAPVVPAPSAPVCMEPKRVEAPRVNGVVDRMPPCPPASPTPGDPLPSVAADQQRPDALRNPAGKGKKKNKKKMGEEKRFIDDVFKPRSESELDGDLDEAEKELEAFKRFCSTPQPPPELRKKIPVNVNMKDIFSSSKKK